MQGNWPCFLYPALAILAAEAFASEGWRRWLSLAGRAAGGALLLALVYAQARLRRHAAEEGSGWRASWAAISPRRPKSRPPWCKAHLADAILTTDYETTAWLRFTQPGLKVIQVNEPWRYPDAPARRRRC